MTACSPPAPRKAPHKLMACQRVTNWTKGAPLGAQKGAWCWGCRACWRAAGRSLFPQQEGSGGCPVSWQTGGAERLPVRAEFAWTLGPEAALGANSILKRRNPTSFSPQFPFSKSNPCFKAQGKHPLLEVFPGRATSPLAGRALSLCTLPGAWAPSAVPGGAQEWRVVSGDGKEHLQV